MSALAYSSADRPDLLPLRCTLPARSAAAYSRSASTWKKSPASGRADRTTVRADAVRERRCAELALVDLLAHPTLAPVALQCRGRVRLRPWRKAARAPSDCERPAARGRSCVQREADEWRTCAPNPRVEPSEDWPCRLAAPSE